MGSRWHFRVFGEELGPLTVAELARYVAQGVVTRDTLVRPENGVDWTPATSVEGLLSEDSAEPLAEEPLAAADAAATYSDADPCPRLSAPRIWRTATPWTVSLVVHAVLLLVLGLWVLPLIGSTGVLEWELKFSHALPDLEAISPSEQAAPTLDAVGLVEAFGAEVASGQSNTVSFAPSLALTSTAPPHAIPDLWPGSWAGLPPAPLGQEVKPAPQAVDRGMVVEAADIEGAVNGVVTGIRKEMAEQDLLVVWLMDASLSLWDDRQRIAQLLGPFYDEFDGLGEDQPTLLMNAAVAYGAGTQELVAPIRFGKKILGAMREAPIDPSGLEHVMLAVQQCVNEYRSRAKGGMLIVIWTDESGDDTHELEETIQLCRRRGVKVSVVGPSSVFGSQRGVQLWVDRASGNRYLLPVKRGPDTSLPERLLLPYWHDASVPAWSQEGAQIEAAAHEYGGPHRERLMSGFGPYALTRLAIETGGDFTIFDQKGNRSPFRLETLRPYQPDYGSAAEYVRSLKHNRLRQAVSAAVMITYQNVIEQPPTMEFVAGRSDEYPYGVVHYYMSPVDFRDQLEDRLAEEQQRAAAALRLINEALSQFRDDDMESEYRREESPRWRAWFDLTRGRLLANRVRYLEYGLACNLIQQAGGLRPETNRLVFHPSPKLRTDSISAKAAQEAKRLLTRCLEKNRDTPWEYLAQWELAQPLGIEVEQVVIPRPANTPRAPAVPVMRGPAPRVSLPRL